jgi:hypothetical protein
MYNIFPLNPELTKSQKKVLESDSDLIIYGPAGSGKTFLTILLAEKLIKSNPNVIIEIIVYTKSLSKFISESLARRNIKNIHVSHIYESSKYADYIILDEFQDFDIQAILKIKKRVRKGMYLLGDLNQQIYTFNNKPKLDKSINSILEFKEINLEETIRFNNGIHNFIADFFPLASNNNLVSNNEKKPEIIKCLDQKKQLQLICDIIISNSKDGDIGILMKENIEVSKILDYFRENKIHFDGYKLNNDEYLNFGKSKVNILTYHSAKGLEFDTIIMPFFETPTDFGIEFYYSGLTRAKENLFILYSDSFPNFLKNIDNNLYNGELIKNPCFENAYIYIEVYKSLYNKIKNNLHPEILIRERLSIFNKIKIDLIEQNSYLSEIDIDFWIKNELNKVEDYV